jgi:general secretion pathway protein G
MVSGMGRRPSPRHAQRRGFTLIELLVVLAIVALMMTIVAPRTIDHLARSREVALKSTLREVRRALDQFEADTGRPPANLDELVARRYLRDVPVDPITERSDAWVLISPAEQDANNPNPATAANAAAGGAGPARDGVADIRSGADGQGRDGTAYRSW